MAANRIGSDGRGSSDSIVGQRKECVKHFNEFRRRRDKSVFEDMNKSDFACKSIFEEFAYYLANDAVKGVTRDPANPDQAAIMVRTGLQYFSSFITAISMLTLDPGCSDKTKEFFEDWPPKNKDFPQWTTNIRHGIEQSMVKTCMKNGIPVVLRCAGIAEEKQKEMSRVLIKRGTST